MSSAHLREEKNCLNCGATVAGKYCQECGQENLEPAENTWHLIRHFMEDFTHFDGKFLGSLKFLLFKPGYLSQEYLMGRRARYLHPVRMYVFISAVFFLLFFSLLSPGRNKSGTHTTRKIVDQIDDSISTDSKLQKDLAANHIKLTRGYTPDDTLAKVNVEGVLTMHQYDSQQHTLPLLRRDGFVKRYFTRKGIAFHEMSKNPEALREKQKEVMHHAIPEVFFLSLPFFALALKLLYIRRKKYTYAAHAIFSLHFFSAAFIIWLPVVIALHYFSTGWLYFAGFVSIMVYLYLAMKRFYAQGGAKTSLKYILLGMIMGILFIFVSIIVVVDAMMRLVSS
ncbi:MAG: DUF3667 domain-containing protein [Taibaiella sp.]|nr:DUF3667 domain-containing protein [Taibaiella sp.]